MRRPSIDEPTAESLAHLKANAMDPVAPIAVEQQPHHRAAEHAAQKPGPAAHQREFQGIHPCTQARSRPRGKSKSHSARPRLIRRARSRPFTDSETEGQANAHSESQQTKAANQAADRRGNVMSCTTAELRPRCQTGERIPAPWPRYWRQAK